MGSLMAGWDSPVPDPKFINLKRNRSMTKEEIANYWKSKTKKEDEHPVLQQSQTFSHRDQEPEEVVKMYKRSTSLPTTKENNSIMETLEEEDDPESKERLYKKHGWWINSRWAFLNEPPVIASETPFRYAAQFHVARKHLNSDHHASANGIRT